MESLPDNHFPRSGRKRFAKWLANAVYVHETELYVRSLDTLDRPEELNIHNNDIRYISDYLNGADDLPNDLWDKSLNEMVRAAEEWHETLKGVEKTGDYQSKEIVYRFENGYTIVSVKNQHDLSVEGEKMGHCVGGYCDAVNRGETEIFSLRSPNNEPHVTIEISPLTNPGSVQQIKGKGNAPPAEKYRPMIKQWLRTTELDYESSDDYMAIMSPEEIEQDFKSGLLGSKSIYRLANRSNSPEIIDMFIRAIEDPLLNGTPTEGPDLLNGATPIGLLPLLAANRFINLEQMVKLFRMDMAQENSLLAGNVVYQFHEPLRDMGDLRPDPTELGDAIWSELGDIIKNNLNNNKFYYLKPMVYYSKNAELRDEILNFILQEDTISNILQRKEETDAHSNRIGTSMTELMSSYLRPVVQGRNNPEIVAKIFSLASSDTGAKIDEKMYYRLQGSLANSSGISSVIAQKIFDKSEKETGDANLFVSLLFNPKVEDELKKEIMTTVAGFPGPQIENHIVSKIIRDVEQRADIGPHRSLPTPPAFTSGFLYWLADNQFLDTYFAKQLNQAYVKKTGRNPPRLWSPEEIKEKVVSWLRSNDPKGEVSEQIRKYFKKNMMTKSSFYDNIKEQLGISEEKGRSRQRGIYKFYCMIAYSLTNDPEKTRGLDDILADMRALPNVTIVTVAVRNQKVAENRYIAGLAIKFIPTTPGDMGTPENVKAAIVRNIKRLQNVQSLFKLSTGLIRLE